MTDHEHAATGPGPGSGPRPTPGAGPQDAAPAAGEGRGSSDAAGPAGEATPPGPPHRFRRDRRFKVLAGVCAGLGRQCDMDPVIFRITLAVLSATGGIGLLFYGFAWLFVPYDDEDENEVRRLLTGRVDGQALAAVLFALVGCGVFLTMLNNGGVLAFAVVLSLLLAGAGTWSRRRGAPGPGPDPGSRPRSSRGVPIAAQAAADAPPEPQAPPVPAAFPSWWRDPVVKDGASVGGTGYLWGPRDYRDVDAAAAINISRGVVRGDREDVPVPRARPPKPRGPRWIGGWVFLLAMLAGVLGTSLTWDGHPLGTSLQTGLACSLTVLGLGIAVSAFLGRTGAGSILLAVVTAGLLAGSAALPKDIGTQWNRTTWRPAAVAEVRHQYDLGTGVGTLDLTRLDLTGKQTVTTRAAVGVGRVKVLVPEDVTVRLRVDVGVGDLQLPGDDPKDVDVKPGRHKEITLSPAGNVRKSGTVDLDLQVGMGQAEVTRAAS
ncbi:MULTISPECIES: PspC domain-containing protein [unclassified Streptomyces]|uniref:PspC domain-containing protein n=1 Tax=unclassified Streptomyces TaxID=2593676 RepID=UPI0004C17E45|nr:MULTISPECIES: PspC domain-containing protein [unclassified Streptomyces]